MENGENVYNQDDATGFIKLNALRLRVKAMVEKRMKTEGLAQPTREKPRWLSREFKVER